MDCSTFAFDLHVLGTPPALILSQDQTLMLKALDFVHRPACAGHAIEAATGLTRGRFIGSALFNPLVIRGLRQPPSHGLTTPVGRFRGTHALTLLSHAHASSVRVKNRVYVLARTI
jgi:hypothetical protein